MVKDTKLKDREAVPNARRNFLVGAASTAALLAIPRRLPAAGDKRMMQVYTTGYKLRHEQQAPVQFQDSVRGTSSNEIVVDAGTRYQTVLGFGSALTDASCFLLSKMEAGARRKLLAETYGPEAMALNLGRMSIGASDYSRSLYSYDDVPGDIALEHFSIEHDQAYVLPMLREVRSANPGLFLLASPWSPPGWMKTFGSMLGGYMSNEFLEPYAHYLARFLQAYTRAGIKIDAITSQNEVEAEQGGSMPAAFWTPEIERDFVRDHLGPLLRKERIDTQIWLLDHNYNLAKRVLWQLKDAKLRSFVSGIAWHGYVGTADMMSRVHDVEPNVPFYWTEGGPDISSPTYATEWANWGKIFTEAMQNWCKGIITWNLMLDPNGDPNIGPFKCGGLVTLKPDGSIAESGQYWTLRHFSQHVRRQAARINSRSDATELIHIAFRNPDGSTAMVVTNQGGSRTVRVVMDQHSADVLVPEDSVTTLVW